MTSMQMPTWLPVKLIAGTPRSASAMHSNDIDTRSPVVSSMSISRPGCTDDTSFANLMRLSVLLPMADTTATTSDPWDRVNAMWSATARIRSGSATEVPPYFWTMSVTVLGVYGAVSAGIADESRRRGVALFAAARKRERHNIELEQ